MPAPTPPPFQLRHAVAQIVDGVTDSGNVVERQIYTPNWGAFASLYRWTDGSGKDWVRAWMVMPDSPVAALEEVTLGMGEVTQAFGSTIIVRGIQSLSEQDAQNPMYEAFFSVVWDVFLALTRQRTYTLTGASVVNYPITTLQTYSNKRIGGAACHTAELRVRFQFDMRHDLV